MFSFLNKLKSDWIKKIKSYLKGIFLYGLIDEVYAEKRCLDHLFLLGLFGKVIGFPFIFNYYYLRFLPYQMKRLDLWKRRVLRERDFFDLIRD